MTLIPTAIPVADARSRLLLSVLPTEAQGLVASGQHVRHVMALYPVSADMAVDLMVAALRGVADLRYEGQVLTFMEHVYKMGNVTRGLRVQAARLLMLDVIPEVAVDLPSVIRAVGTHQTNTHAGGYRDLARVILVLSAWSALGDEAFTVEQLAFLHKVAAFWFAVLDFDWRW